MSLELVKKFVEALMENHPARANQLAAEMPAHLQDIARDIWTTEQCRYGSLITVSPSF